VEAEGPTPLQNLQWLEVSSDLDLDASLTSN